MPHPRQAVPTCLHSPCGPQEGSTAPPGRPGLRVPAEPLNSLKYNQPLSLPAICWGRAEILPSLQLGTAPWPGRSGQPIGGPNWLPGEVAGQQEEAARRRATLPAAAALCLALHPGQGRGAAEPHKGKPGPRGTTQGPGPPGWGLPRLRATAAGSVLTSHFLAPNPATQERSERPRESGKDLGSLCTICAAFCASIIILK